MREVEIVRSRRRSLGLEVKHDGRVIARAPYWMPKAAVRAFVEKNSAWIEAHVREAEARRAAQPLPATVRRRVSCLR